MGARAISTSLFLPGRLSLGGLSSEGADVSASALQSELDLEKGLEMRKWVLSGILASEETYLSHLEALLLVSVPRWNSPHTSV
jgi:breakpoint cluster region protein